MGGECRGWEKEEKKEAVVEIWKEMLSFPLFRLEVAIGKASGSFLQARYTHPCI